MRSNLHGSFVSFLFLFASVSAQGSAGIQWLPAQGVLQVRATLHYSGPALTPELARASTEEIQRLWNESRAVIPFRGTEARVEFVFREQIYLNGREPRWRSWAADCEQNWIEIRHPTSSGDRSYYYLGGSMGVFFTSDELGTSTTTAHEFGHGLGLDHDPLDQRAAPVPGIMFARGTWVRSEFQWDPQAQAGRPGGTLRPHTRRVREEDVRALGLDRVHLDSKGYGCLGGGKSVRGVRH